MRVKKTEPTQKELDYWRRIEEMPFPEPKIAPKYKPVHIRHYLNWIVEHLRIADE